MFNKFPDKTQEDRLNSSPNVLEFPSDSKVESITTEVGTYSCEVDISGYKFTLLLREFEGPDGEITFMIGFDKNHTKERYERFLARVMQISQTNVKFTVLRQGQERVSVNFNYDPSRTKDKFRFKNWVAETKYNFAERYGGNNIYNRDSDKPLKSIKSYFTDEQ